MDELFKEFKDESLEILYEVESAIEKLEQNLSESCGFEKFAQIIHRLFADAVEAIENVTHELWSNIVSSKNSQVLLEQLNCLASQVDPNLRSSVAASASAGGLSERAEIQKILTKQSQQLGS